MPDRRRTLLLALGSLILLRAGLGFGAAERIGTFTLDAAHHATVARTIAAGVPHDPVLWHYLAPPPTVERPPGDYWPAGWPWLLGRALGVLGSSLSSVVLICALLSLLLPLATFWLARELGLPRREAWFAGALVALLGPLQAPSVTPDVTLPYQLVCLAALALAVRSWRTPRAHPALLALTGALAMSASGLRGDGVVLLVTVVATAWAPRNGGDRSERLLFTALGAALALAPLLTYELHTFGEFAPPARRSVPWLTHPWELFAYARDPSPAGFVSAGPLALILRAVRDGGLGLFALLPWALVFLAGVEAARVRDGERGSHAWPLTAFVAVSLLVPAVLSAAIFNPNRLAHNTAPVLCVLAAWSLTDLRSLRHLHRGLPGLLAGALLLLATSWVLPTYAALPWDARWLGDELGPPAPLQPAGRPPLPPDAVVMTTNPWQAGWELGVRCVQVPVDGIAATDAVIERYGVTHLIVVPDRSAHYLSQLTRPWRTLIVTRQGSWVALGARD